MRIWLLLINRHGFVFFFSLFRLFLVLLCVHRCSFANLAFAEKSSLGLYSLLLFVSFVSCLIVLSSSFFSPIPCEFIIDTTMLYSHYLSFYSLPLSLPYDSYVS